MSKYFIQGKRQSGKSQLARYEFMKDPLDSIMIVSKNSDRKEMLDDIRAEYKCSKWLMSMIKERIMTASEDVLKGASASRLIVDEMLFFKDYEDLAADMHNAFDYYYIFSSLYPKGNVKRKAQKKFIDKLMDDGFLRMRLKKTHQSRMILMDEVSHIPYNHGSTSTEIKFSPESGMFFGDGHISPTSIKQYVDKCIMRNSAQLELPFPPEDLEPRTYNKQKLW